MPKKKPTKREALRDVPQSQEELASAVAQVGRIKREINEKVARANKKTAKIQEDLNEEVAPLSEELDGVLDGIHAYAESNRDALTQSGKVKTVKLTTGRFYWRTTPPRVTLRKVDEVIEALKELGLERFIRVKEEPDKAAMLRERKVVEGVKGVTVTQHEEFVVEPSEIEVAVTKKLPKARKSQ